MQLTQQNVQKSKSTNLPFKSLILTGDSVFSQSRPSGNSGAWTTLCSVKTSSLIGCSHLHCPTELRLLHLSYLKVTSRWMGAF